MNGHIIHATKFSTDINQFQMIAENEDFSKNDLRVFIFLSCRLGSQRFTRVDKSQISDSLNISKKKIGESLDNLERFGIITKGSDEHTKNGYKMTYTSGNM